MAQKLSPIEMERLLQSVFSGVNSQRGEAQTVIEKFVNQANSMLQTDPAYMSNVLKMQQAQSQMQQNTQNIQDNLQDSTQQILDANQQAKEKQQTTGLGNTGLGAYQSLNTQSSDKGFLRQLNQATQSNRQTLDSINTYETANQMSLLKRLQNRLGNMKNDPNSHRYLAGIDWSNKDALWKDGKWWASQSGLDYDSLDEGQKRIWDNKARYKIEGNPYWNVGGVGNIASEDLDQMYDNLDNLFGQDASMNTTPDKKPEF